MSTTSSIRNQEKNQLSFNVRLDWLEKKRSLATSDEVKDTIALSKGNYVFTRIDLFPKIFIANEAFRAKAQQALTNSVSNSLVVNSSKAALNCRAEILLDLHPKFV